MRTRPPDGVVGSMHGRSGEEVPGGTAKVGCSLEGFKGEDHRDGRSEVIANQDDMVVVKGGSRTNGGWVLGHGVPHMDAVFITLDNEGKDHG